VWSEATTSSASCRAPIDDMGPQAVRRWGVAGAVLAVSFLPFIGDGMDGGTRVSLALMHLAVAAVLIPGLGGTSPGAGVGAAGG
jgi:hypothetical protein